jgi:hypothetical protein
VDGHGDFTWKDVSAAGRSGLSVEDYVIGGLDPDFRELLFAAGHAMDAAGVGWTILSGFRDDFRQDLVSGLKARVNNSFHGGMRMWFSAMAYVLVDRPPLRRARPDRP